jgi:hypothetical protein
MKIRRIKSHEFVDQFDVIEHFLQREGTCAFFCVLVYCLGLINCISVRLGSAHRRQKQCTSGLGSAHRVWVGVAVLG